jgi:hypothetical protein
VNTRLQSQIILQKNEGPLYYYDISKDSDMTTRTVATKCASVTRFTAVLSYNGVGNV